MKKLLPALCLLLALTACTRPAPAQTPPETAESADATAAVTLDLAAYTDAAQGDVLSGDPRFFLDEALTQQMNITETTSSGARVTYTVAVPAGTADLYMVPPQLCLTEEVEEQSAPAKGDQDLGNFRVESVELENGADLELVVKIDPASTAFPENLHLQMDGMYYTGGHSRRMEWGDDQVTHVKEWAVSFTMKGSVAEAEKALETATLHWSQLSRYVQPQDLPCTADGVTVHPVNPGA